MKVSNTILTRSAICIGVSTSLLYLFEIFYIVYFTSIGIRESASSLGFSLLLTCAGLIGCNNVSLGRALITGYTGGTVLERILVCILYWDYVDIGIMIVPLISSLLVGSILIMSLGNHQIRSKHMWIALFLILVIAVLPKII